MEEFAMLALRLTEGLTEERFQKRFGKKIPEIYRRNAEKFAKYGFLSLDENGIRLTPKGFLISNCIISEILG